MESEHPGNIIRTAYARNIVFVQGMHMHAHAYVCACMCVCARVHASVCTCAHMWLCVACDKSGVHVPVCWSLDGLDAHGNIDVCARPGVCHYAGVRHCVCPASLATVEPMLCVWVGSQTKSCGHKLSCCMGSWLSD